jgi:predicted MFS family arabinose efflux permease
MPAVATTVKNNQAEGAQSGPAAPAWSAVFAIAVTVATLLTSELLPGSLLTPMARDLGLSEGMAGQAVTATGLAAMTSSLLIGTVARRFDRRRVVMAFAVLLTASSLIVAIAPDFLILLAGRILLGFALGGFWSLSASLAMRLVPPAEVPKALSIVFSGVSVAMVIAAPVGTLLGAVIGWRGVFLLAAALGAGCWLWQARVLPAMPPHERVGGVRKVARRPGVGMAMLAIFCVFAGQFAFFTYMRPFFETVTGLGVSAAFPRCCFCSASPTSPGPRWRLPC